MSEEQRRVRSEPGFRFCTKRSSFTCESNINQSRLETSLQTATLMWSTAHGIATLQHNRMLDTFDQEADAEAMLRTATRAILKVKRLIPAVNWMTR